MWSSGLTSKTNGTLWPSLFLGHIIIAGDDGHLSLRKSGQRSG
jgi:hypothetical protein